MISTLLLLAQMGFVNPVAPSEQRLLTGEHGTCSVEIDPSAGPYTLTLWMPSDNQRWQWTYLEEPFFGRTVVNGCKTGCVQKWVITRFAPYSSANVVPDGYSVAFTCHNCYHAFLVQRSQSRDVCNRSEEP